LARDVLGKVTIIRDIAVANPHRGHLEILASFALQNLVHPQRIPINNFDTLHAAWEEIFNVDLLNQRFYRELANWYFWALPQVDFPTDIEKHDEKRCATSLIRLLTRLIFCWFLKEKGLIPEDLFVEAELKNILTDLDPDSCTYHQAILQNLFFATLNQRMGKDKNGQPYRGFARDEGFQKNRTTYGVDTLYRYEEQFRDRARALDHFADVPFLNGGLFECLDRTEEGTGKKLYLDGFSRNKKKRSAIPNRLFFAREQTADLSDAYGEPKRRNEKVRGLLRILHSYKFTIVENTPIDQEIALDPELLGKVFENLLASYNEETKPTARKQTGSFYTPRAIVEYMVDESLKAHLTDALITDGMSEKDAETGLDILFAYTERKHPFTEHEADTLLEAIHTCKILDPACGSGAFPMGMLQKLVYIVHKLDPDNARWKQLQIDAAAKIPDPSSRDAAITAIERDFADNEDDYGRKLYLIENCLYGVDIQPIAIQIAKLRFFISLVCDQRTNRSKKINHGIRPLPNLETKFVAADTLIGLASERQLGLDLFANPAIKRLEAELQRVRHDHFAATTRQRKLGLQKRDRELRGELAHHLAQTSFADQETSLKLAAWDPYDPQQSADFFEPLWMFDQSLADGFHLIIGNPPYISVERFAGTAMQIEWQKAFTTYAARGDVYGLFYERGAALLRPGGTLTYISSNKWMRMGYGEKLRDFLSRRVNVDSVLDFGMAQNFGAATTYTCITRFSAGAPDGSVLSCYVTDDIAAMSDPAGYFEVNAVRQKSLSSEPWVVISKPRQRIKELVEAQGVPLQKWDIQINYGIKTGFNEAYYLTAAQRDDLIAEDPASDELISKFVRGRDVERYKVNWDDTYQLIVKFGAHEYLEERYPAVFRHLERFEKQLKARGQCKYGRERRAKTADKPYPGQHHWLELDNNPGDGYLRLFKQPKIIYQDIAQSLPFYLDNKENFYFNNTLWMLNGDSSLLPYLTALLNSSIFRCCFRDNFPEYSGNAYRLFAIFMVKIRFKKPTPEQAALFEKLVHLIQRAKVTAEEAPAQFLEDLIDACVFECYFREHMAERDLLFLEDLAPCLAVYQPDANEAKQRDFLEHFHRALNAPDAKIRNRLLRLTADSPDLLGVVKEEGRV
jgi:adenine-specific DNA-methyltransferase